MQASEVVERLRNPDRLWRRSELAGRGSPVPATSGIYGWYFLTPLPGVPTEFGTRVGDATLLYVGIAPTRGSGSNLRKRLRQHCFSNASGSTLRFTLGCILSQQLGIELALSPSGRLHFADDEAVLSNWMDEFARVTWVEHAAPWEVEGDVVRSLNLPLNREHNGQHPFHPLLGEVRRAARERARKHTP